MVYANWAEPNLGLCPINRQSLEALDNSIRYMRTEWDSHIREFVALVCEHARLAGDTLAERLQPSWAEWVKEGNGRIRPYTGVR